MSSRPEAPAAPQWRDLNLGSRSLDFAGCARFARDDSSVLASRLSCCTDHTCRGTSSRWVTHHASSFSRPASRSLLRGSRRSLLATGRPTSGRVNAMNSPIVCGRSCVMTSLHSDSRKHKKGAWSAAGVAPHAFVSRTQRSRDKVAVQCRPMTSAAIYGRPPRRARSNYQHGDPAAARRGVPAASPHRLLDAAPIPVRAMESCRCRSAVA